MSNHLLVMLIFITIRLKSKLMIYSTTLDLIEGMKVDNKKKNAKQNHHHFFCVFIWQIVSMKNELIYHYTKIMIYTIVGYRKSIVSIVV